MSVDASFKKLVQFCSVYTVEEGLNKHEQLEDFVQPRNVYNPQQIALSKELQGLLGIKGSRFQSDQKTASQVASFVRGYMDQVTAAHYLPEKYPEAFVRVKTVNVKGPSTGDSLGDALAEQEERLINAGTFIRHSVNGTLKVGQYFFLNDKLTKFTLDLIRVK